MGSFPIKRYRVITDYGNRSSIITLCDKINFIHILYVRESCKFLISDNKKDRVVESATRTRCMRAPVPSRARTHAALDAQPAACSTQRNAATHWHVCRSRSRMLRRVTGSRQRSRPFTYTRTRRTAGIGCASLAERTHAS